ARPRPSTKPVPLSPLRNAIKEGGEGSSEPAPISPTPGSVGCCARAASGQAAAAPPSSVINSRRFNGSKSIRSPASQDRIAGYRIGSGQSGGDETILQPVGR